MQSKELLRAGLQLSDQLVLPMLEDLKGEPLAAPTANGGNHPWWIAGHLTFGEGNLFWNYMRGEPNPVAEWKDFFDGGTQPCPEGKQYPPYEELLGKYRELREQTLTLLDSLREQDLDQPSKNVSEELRGFFGTYRQCFLVAILHGMMHRGQLADVRRSLGRGVLMA